MGNRLTKIYTRTGDNGTTGMANGDRASKAELPFVVMGDVDELNAQVGMVAAHMRAAFREYGNRIADTFSPSVMPEDLLTHLSIVQHLLFNVGGELAMPEYQGITQKHIEWLEGQIDTLNQHLTPLKDFILPAGSVLVCQVHIARTVCRRSERQAVQLKEQQPEAISPLALTLINRLSDWLFVLARYCSYLEANDTRPSEDAASQYEVLWNKDILTQLQ